MMTGPLFDGRAAAEVRLYCRETEEFLAEEAARRIQEFLPTQYKYLGHGGGNPKDNPQPSNAGYYEAHGARVTDSDVIYGPWLEGVSERNQAYRFPGYGAFRRASQQLDMESAVIADRKMAPYVAAMNGVGV
jgi:hypothetical protein